MRALEVCLSRKIALSVGKSSWKKTHSTRGFIIYLLGVCGLKIGKYIWDT
jgi:hypothetical protein